MSGARGPVACVWGVSPRPGAPRPARRGRDPPRARGPQLQAPLPPPRSDDPAQFDARSEYYDPKASPEEPRWSCVDLAFGRRLPRLVPLREIKAAAAEGTGPAELAEFLLLTRPRLSCMPVPESVFAWIVALGDGEGA